MKLKTSKDLEKAVHVGDVMKFLDEENEVGTDWMTSIILAGDLKAEAVKWYHRSDGNKHKFIMDFFNLTESDLEENNGI